MVSPDSHHAPPIRTYQIVTALQAGGQCEGVVSAVVRNVLVCPGPIDVVTFIDLEPASTNSGCLGCIVDRSEQEMGDRAGVRRSVPVDCNAVALAGCDGCNPGGNDAAVHVASKIVARDIGLYHCQTKFVNRSRVNVRPDCLKEACECQPGNRG